MNLRRSNDGPLAILTLDHGELNLLTRSVIDSLDAEMRELAANPPRALLIRAEPSCFKRR
jgi:enoyl-CoA hydratase